MDIVNINNKTILACARFEYMGYTVSFSTIMRNSHVLIYPTDEPTVEVYKETVEDAIWYVNEQCKIL